MLFYSSYERAISGLVHAVRDEMRALGYVMFSAAMFVSSMSLCKRWGWYGLALTAGSGFSVLMWSLNYRSAKKRRAEIKRDVLEIWDDLHAVGRGFTEATLLRMAGLPPRS